MRAAVVVNPTARRAAEALTTIRGRVGAAGIDLPMVLETTPDDLGVGQAARAVDAGCEVVIACGGDGTVRAVAQGLRGSETSLGIVPLGTANILARNLGLRPRELEANVAAATGPGRRPMDLGIARLCIAGEWSDELVFFVMAGVGGDASTIALVSRRLKARLGWAAYFAAGARTAFHAPVGMGIAVDGAPAEQRQAWGLLAGNTATVPPGIQLFPGARPDDGLLHLVEVRVERPWQWSGIAASGLARRRAVARRLVHTAARDVEVLLPSPQPVQLDGDLFGPADAVRLHLAASAVTIVVPSRSQTEVGAALGHRG